tara:strand:- start:2105 stop:2380 length:276 start_codon:yes stop_codon:yes gene_type:complete
MENPLDKIDKVNFIEFLFAKKRKFVKHTINEIVLEDHLEWSRFEAKISIYVYHNYKEICERINTKSEKTIEIIELLIKEKYEKEFETSKND